MNAPLHTIAFILLPEFALMTFCSTCEPFRVANRLSKKKLYHWDLYSLDGKPVTSSNSMTSHVNGSIDDIKNVDLLVVVSSFNPQANVSKSLLNTIKKISLAGTILSGVDTGAYILARAGLLDDYKATIHWEDLANFRQIFPQIDVLTDRYVIDRKRLTAAGAAASMDMVLELISQDHGGQLARQIAEQFIYSPSLQLDKEQRLPVAQRLQTNHPIVLEAVSLMENHLEDNLTTSQIANLCNISLRQLERLFKNCLGSTPGKWYKLLKLKNAQIQLKQSHYTVAEIAANNGFESTSSFSRAYKAQYSCSPSNDRENLKAFS